MKILLDTDILIDIGLGRAPHVDASGRLVDRVEGGAARGYIAWHSASNFYYLMAAGRSKAEARRFLMDLLTFVEVAPTQTAHLRSAVELEMKDLEDAMQVAAAIACKADVVATRNTRDFARSPVRAVTPVALLKELG